MVRCEPVQANSASTVPGVAGDGARNAVAGTWRTGRGIVPAGAVRDSGTEVSAVSPECW
jgi:hypothetical protein